LLFLRDTSVLLAAGQRQFEVRLQYQMDDSDTVLARVQNNVFQIGEAKLRQRLLLMPLELRYGFSPVTQLFVNVPFGWSNGEVSFLNEDEFNNVGGIGDVSAGFTRQILDGKGNCPDVLFSFSFSAPTGNSSFASSLSTPGANLGEGVWSLTGALTAIHTYDPVVVFYGFGYRHRFEGFFDDPLSDVDLFVNPGSQILYRFGVGFAINPQITLSASFLGQYISEPSVNGVRLAGTIREPMQVRLAATIVRGQKTKTYPYGPPGIKFIEPYVNFGLTDAAIDSIIGVSVTW
ncbi:MAG TPA: transporter, partial [Pirellulaceae bacterium]|nr:transporter [Pirellulaceae bacterium]